MSPFRGRNLSARLLLGNVFIVTSVPWWTPQNSHSIEGVAAGAPGVPKTTDNVAGTTIAACGQGLASIPSTTSIWTGLQCVDASGTTVPLFPNNVKLPAFNIPHGPFPMTSTPTYACLICGGGESGNAANPGAGWNSDSTGQQLSNVRLDLGNNDNIFGYYTVNASERSVYSGVRWGDYGTVSGAGFFFDNSEAPQTSGGTMPTNLSGTTRPVLRDLSLTDGVGVCPKSGSNPGCYGIIQEGSRIVISITSMSPPCATTPIVWATSVNTSGAIDGVAIGSGGSCTGTLTCTATGAPVSPWGTGTDATGMCTATATGGVITSVATPIMPINPAIPFPASFQSGGMILENVNFFPSIGGSGKPELQEGLWMEGVTNPLIGHFHCTAMNGYCEHIGAGQPLTGGVFITHDSLTATSGLIDLGVGVDGNQVLLSMSAPAGTSINTILDEKNNVALPAATFPKVAQYLQPLLAYVTGPGANGNVSFSTSANTAEIFAITLPNSVRVANITYRVTTADTSSSMTDTYDIGIIDAAGSVRVHLGSKPASSYVGTAATFTKPVATPAVLPEGKYYIAITNGNCTTCAAISAATNQFSALIGTLSVTHGGDLTGIAAPTADMPAMGIIPVFLLN